MSPSGRSWGHARTCSRPVTPLAGVSEYRPTARSQLGSGSSLPAVKASRAGREEIWWGKQQRGRAGSAVCVAGSRLG